MIPSLVNNINDYYPDNKTRSFLLLLYKKNIVSVATIRNTFISECVFRQLQILLEYYVLLVQL